MWVKPYLLQAFSTNIVNINMFGFFELPNYRVYPLVLYSQETNCAVSLFIQNLLSYKHTAGPHNYQTSLERFEGPQGLTNWTTRELTEVTTISITQVS